MADLFTVTPLDIPLQVVSGSPFVLSFVLDSWDAVLQTEWLYERIQSNEIDCQLMIGNEVLATGMSYLSRQSSGGRYKYSGNLAFYISEIEYLLNRVPQADENPSIVVWLVLKYRYAGPGQEKYSPGQETHSYNWTVSIAVPKTVIYAGQMSFPSRVKKGTTFNITARVDYPDYPLDVTYMRNYIEATAVGEDGVSRTYTLWQDEFEGLIFSPGLIHVSGINIENILGTLTIPYQHYDITLTFGSTGSVKITGRETTQGRSDEATALWPVDVVVGYPDPDFVDPSATGSLSIYPPYSIESSGVFHLRLEVENYGAPGIIYINNGGSEVWRSKSEITLGGTDFWDAGMISIDRLEGTVIRTTEDGYEYQVVFTCGYIDESGNKVSTGSLVRNVYVVEAGPPPPTPPPPPPETGAKASWVLPVGILSGIVTLGFVGYAFAKQRGHV